MGINEDVKYKWHMSLLIVTYPLGVLPMNTL